MLQWKMGKWIESCNPLKMFEYMASGRPIVSVPIKEAMQYSEIISIAHNKEEFCKAIRWELQNDTVERSRRRIEIAGNHSWDNHIEKITKLELVDVKAIKKANFRVAIDCVNSTGGIALPKLLKALGVSKVDPLYCEPNGKFPHNPEPLPENLGEISEIVKKNKADVGFVVDPDVDRLAIITENGEVFGEEYTLVAVADYILKNIKGNTVSNLSSTRALQDITENQGGKYFASAVGEVNVVEKMKAVNAVIGGEGNGGIIYPELHYGRDALVGIALFLTYLAKTGLKCSKLRSTYPGYYISKNKIELSEGIEVNDILKKIEEKYKMNPINTIDGVRIEFDKQWVHLRKSNTEPIIRIYSESDSEEKANHLAKKIIEDIEEALRN